MATRCRRPISSSSKGIDGAMTREALREQIVDTGIIPSIRTASAADARFAAETLASAGIRIVEMTMTVPDALEIIADLSRTVPDLIVGAGTVFDVPTARRAIEEIGRA